MKRSSKISILLWLSIWILSAHASSTPIYQVALSDADKKEILAVLFQRELSAAQSDKERVVLLSPRADATWLLELPGLRFKQLSYGDEKQASEYYELHFIKIDRDYLEVSLSKGNYCKKGGSVYQFRKEAGRWIVKSVRGTETFTAWETVCAGCEPGSGSLYRMNYETAQPARPKEPPKALRLTGKATATNCQRTEAKYIECKLDLSLDFSNHGNQPIIILQPHGDYEFWHGASTLALTKADSEARNYVYDFAAWPSIYKTEVYRLLAETLDQKTPPANLTRTVSPGENWNWKTTIQLRISEDNTCGGRAGVQIGWNGIKKLSAPLWLTVSYEMWPFNVENFRKDLGGRLRERWKQSGVLYLEEKRQKFWFAHLTSEPIELDFQQVSSPSPRH